MSADKATYLDSSALVKLVLHEPESTALATFLRRRRVRVSSALARTELVRAIRPIGADQLRRVRDVLAGIGLLRVSDRVLDAAGQMPPAELRSLDAIHLATAGQLEDELGSFVTYDDRLAAAAAARGMRVARPR